MVAFLSTEGTEVGAFFFAVGADSVAAFDIPDDAQDAVVGGDEGVVAVICPCRLAVLEFNRSGAVVVQAGVVASLPAYEAVGR